MWNFDGNQWVTVRIGAGTQLLGNVVVPDLPVTLWKLGDYMEGEDKIHMMVEALLVYHRMVGPSDMMVLLLVPMVFLVLLGWLELLLALLGVLMVQVALLNVGKWMDSICHFLLLLVVVAAIIR